MKRLLKNICNFCFSVIMLPPYLLAIVCDWISGGEEGFLFFSQSISVIPGKIGEYARRGFYKWALSGTGSSLVVGFGSFFTHSDSEVGNGVWIGQYSIIGRCRIEDDVLISDHVSILSGRRHHDRGPDGAWTENRQASSVTIIGGNSWIGAGATVMANIGRGSTVGAGSIVVHDVENETTVAGNPARPIGTRSPEEGDEG